MFAGVVQTDDLMSVSMCKTQIRLMNILFKCLFIFIFYFGLAFQGSLGPCLFEGKNSVERRRDFKQKFPSLLSDTLTKHPQREIGMEWTA